MSRFLTKINELLGEAPKVPATKSDREKQETQDTIARAKDRVNKGSKDPLDVQLVKKSELMRKKALKKLSEPAKLAGEADVVGDEPVPGPEGGASGAPAPTDPGAAPAEPAPLTTEGESFLVNLARKALFVDLDNTSLTDEERETITQDVQPENAKQVARVLRKIVVDYGLAEGFDTRIDSLIEDLKKNDRIVVLVPGSFKPPHKGHYAMIKHFFEIADETIVVISDPGPKSIRCTPVKNLHVTAQQARQILEIYTKGKPVTFITTSQPVKWVYDYVAEDTQPGQKILLGVSGKGDDAGRYANAQSYAPDGVEVEPSVFTAGDLNISASGFRNVVDQIPQLQHSEPPLEPDQRTAFINNQLSPYLPDDLTDNDKYKVFDILSTLTCPTDSL